MTVRGGKFKALKTYTIQWTSPLMHAVCSLVFWRETSRLIFDIYFPFLFNEKDAESCSRALMYQADLEASEDPGLGGGEEGIRLQLGPYDES